MDHHGGRGWIRTSVRHYAGRFTVCCLQPLGHPPIRVIHARYDGGTGWIRTNAGFPLGLQSSAFSHSATGPLHRPGSCGDPYPYSSLLQPYGAPGGDRTPDLRLRKPALFRLSYERSPHHDRRLERAKGFEPSTPTLARLCSTPELRPRYQSSSSSWGDRRDSNPWHQASQACALPTELRPPFQNDATSRPLSHTTLVPKSPDDVGWFRTFGSRPPVLTALHLRRTPGRTIATRGLTDLGIRDNEGEPCSSCRRE